jgi:CPA2 family monovalent cation:H+ antiporter-2
MHEAGLLFTLTVGLSAALILGFVTKRLGLSPIVGYLLAGIAVGPYTPGVFADTNLARQLAEVGVILLMFGVGLHFRLTDLSAVKAIAIPGAILLSATVTSLATVTAMKFGWNLQAGLVLGLAISVSSTVVLIRVLQDNKVFDTAQGHVAVGWVVMEDILSVLVLVMLPALSSLLKGGGPGGAEILLSLGIALTKVAAFAGLMIYAGSRFVPWLLTNVAHLRSRELFTLSVFSLALAISFGASFLFGTSIALGAFIAGIVVGQSNVSHQAAADALPMRDAFAVLFFVSVGMLLDPRFLINKPGLVLSVLAIIMVLRPLAAMLIILFRGYSSRIVLTVSLLLAQVGEFSFILAQLAESLGILPSDGYNTIVACSLFSIAVNPLLFRAIDPLELWLNRRSRLWGFLNHRAIKRGTSATMQERMMVSLDARPRAIVVGYGPVGQTVTRILRKFGIEPVIVDLNINTVTKLSASGFFAIYGDAGQRNILEAAGITKSDYLLITLPDLTSRIPVIVEARALNPAIKILVRARYLAERSMLEELEATAVCYEEAEAAVALADLLLQEIGAKPEEMEEEADLIRKEWAIHNQRFNQ